MSTFTRRSVALSALAAASIGSVITASPAAAQGSSAAIIAVAPAGTHGLLLPAVHPGELLPAVQPGQAALLLPAVQKVREAAAR
jgi:hypothetical protein